MYSIEISLSSQVATVEQGGFLRRAISRVINLVHSRFFIFVIRFSVVNSALRGGGGGVLVMNFEVFCFPDCVGSYFSIDSFTLVLCSSAR